MIDLGDVYRITAVVRDLDGESATAVSAVCTVTLPDGTTTSPTTVITAGKVTADYQTTMLGRHTFTVSTMEPVTVFGDVFDVRSPQTYGILSLRDAKQHLNMSLASDSNDEELRGFILAATSVVEFHAGATVVREYTQRVHATGAVPLAHWPVTEVVSIDHVTGGSAYDPAGVVVDDSGVLRLPGGVIEGDLQVVYRAGHVSVPANRVQAAKIIVQHLWETQRSDQVRRPLAPTARDTVNAQDQAGRWFAIPRKALELLQPDRAGWFA